jgi:two-component system, NtrC family, nitrogen regulation sensor histidine kinase NtrY
MLLRNVWWPLMAGILILAFSVYWRTPVASPDISVYGKEVEVNVQEQLTQLMRDAKRIALAVAQNKPWPKSKFVFHAYDSGELVLWNSHEPVPAIATTDSLSLQQLGNSYYITYQKKLEHQVIVGYLWLQKNHPIQNSYLVNRVNEAVLPAMAYVELVAPVQVITYKGYPIFGISFRANQTVKHRIPAVGWATLVLGAALFLIGLRSAAVTIKRRGFVVPAVFLVFMGLLALRLVMVYGQYPGLLVSWDVFNPKQFASSTFNDSIGNFFLNSLAFMISGWVAYDWVVRERFIFRAKQGVWHSVYALVALLLAFGFHLLPFLYAETIFHNSAATLDITRQLYFDPLRWLSVGCFLLSIATAFFYFQALFRLAVFCLGKRLIRVLLGVGLSAVLMFIYHWLTKRNYEVPIILCTVHLFILIVGFWYGRPRLLQHQTFAVIFIGLLIFAWQSAWSVQVLTHERDVRAMKRYANSFLVDQDVLAEYLLIRAAEAIAKDNFIQQQFSNAFGSLTSIKHKIQRTHISSYFDRYELDIHMHDAHGLSFGETVLSVDSLRRNYRLLNGLPNDMFVGKSNQPGQNGYLVIVPFRAVVSGYVSITVSLREVSPVTVFPRLLLDDRFSHYARQADFSYAIYAHGHRQHTAGVFQYQLHDMQKKLADPRLFREGVVMANYFHLGMEDIGGRVIVVSAPPYTLFNTLTSFSFFFLMGLLLCVVALGVHELMSKKVLPLPYSARIQLYVYVALMLPAAIIAITTLRLNTSTAQQYSEGENMQKASRLAQNLSALMSDNPMSVQEALQANVRAIGADATVFWPSGKFLATSQPEIYANYILGNLLHPEVLQEINRGNFLFTRQDQVDNLSFKTTYSVIQAPDSNAIQAILAMPFFESQQAAEQDQLRLASNFWVVVALVFIVFYLASFVALSWLTQPLLVISATLRKTTLTGANRKLTWHSRDEIGEMVNEYNKMIDNLEISKTDLARKQREDAWREMARQVAHEIKNPLTPIKLTLQQMERNLAIGQWDPEKSKQSIKTVLHQVDILSEISSTFSAFAQMPTPVLEPTDLRLIVQETVALYAQTAPHQITWVTPPEPVLVLADKKLFMRIFGNVILNAFQAGEGRAITVVITVQQRDKQAILSFRDNGPGMAPEVRDKIFIPYFSTKQTGSGLGLAIARQGIEQAGGRIDCESTLGDGATFLITLPIINP